MPQMWSGQDVTTWASDGLVQATVEGDRQRLERIAKAWRYYEGDQEPQLVRRPGEKADDNVTMNVVETAIDAVTDFMFGEHLELPLNGMDPEGEEQDYVDRCWRTSGGMSLLGDLRTNGAVAGHAFLKLEVTEGQLTRVMPPRLRVLDPSTVTPFCTEDDHSIVMEYRIAWNVTRGNKVIAKRQRIVNEGLGWVIVDEESDAATTRWTVTGTTRWLYPWPPVIDTKNLPRPNQYWGRPDVDVDLLRLQDAINAVGSDARRVSRLLGHTQVWASGVQGDDLSADPGEAILLPDDAKMGVVGPPSTPDAHLRLLERFKSAFHEQVRVPEVTAGRLDGIGQLSGLAMRILYGPLMRKVSVARGLYGGLIDETNRRLLELADYEVVETKPAWPKVVPTDPKEDALTAQERQKAGVSIQTTLQELGLDPEAEATQRQVEAESRPVNDLGAALLGFNAGQ